MITEEFLQNQPVRQFVTIQDVASHAGWTTQTVFNAVWRKDIAYLRPGRDYMLYRPSVNTWLAQKGKPPMN